MRGISSGIRDQANNENVLGIKILIDLGSGINIFGKNVGSVTKKYTSLRPSWKLHPGRNIACTFSRWIDKRILPFQNLIVDIGLIEIMLKKKQIWNSTKHKFNIYTRVKFPGRIVYTLGHQRISFTVVSHTLLMPNLFSMSLNWRLWNPDEGAK